MEAMRSRNADSTTVLIDGASGYLGSHLVRHLTRKKYRTKALIHEGARHESVELLSSTGATVFRSNLQDSGEKRADLLEYFSGVDFAVHLIGSIAPKKGESLLALHEESTRHFVEIAKSSHIKKIVLVTALGAAPDGEDLSMYHRTKWAAEEVLRNSGLAYTILRPSLLLGRTFGNRDSKLIKRLFDMVSTKRLIPLVNGGQNHVQPVFIDDITMAIERAFSSEFDSRTLELGGNEIISIRDLVGKIQKLAGKNQPVITLSPSIANIVAGLLEKLQEVPLLSKDQVLIASKDNICANNSLPELLNCSPATINEALATYAGLLPACSSSCYENNMSQDYHPGAKSAEIASGITPEN